MLLRVTILAVLAAVAACPQWQPVGPFGGAAELVRVSPVAPHVLMGAAGNGLVYRSNDRGESWTHLPFPVQLGGTLHALVPHPKTRGVWYAGFQSENTRLSGVYVTRDDGASWTSLPGIAGKAVWSLAIREDNSGAIAAGAADGVYLSADLGQTWKKISPDDNLDLRPVVSLEFDPIDRKTIYAGTTHLPWRTRDGGSTWQSIHSGMIDDSDVFSIQVDPRRPAIVFASACSGVYRSVNSGTMWRRLPTPKGAFRTYFVAVDPRAPDTVFAGTTAGLLKSSNSGSAWRTVSQAVVRSIAFDPAKRGRVYFASSTAGLLRSDDLGETIVAVNAGFGNHNFTATDAGGDALYTAASFDAGTGGLLRSNDLGATWKAPGKGIPGNQSILMLAVAPNDPDRVFAVTHGGLYSSGDGGQSWIYMQPPPGTKINAIATVAPRHVLAGTKHGVYIAEAGGKWKGLVGGNVRYLQRTGDKAVAMVSDDAAYVSSTGHDDWTTCNPPVEGAFWYGIAFDPAAKTVIAATTKGLFRSGNRCHSWQPAGDPLNGGTVNAVLLRPERPGEAYATQYGKVFRSADGGRSWSALSDAGRNGLYPSSLLLLPAASDRLFALFPKRGILFHPIGPPGDAGGSAISYQ